MPSPRPRPKTLSQLSLVVPWPCLPLQAKVYPAKKPGYFRLCLFYEPGTTLPDGASVEVQWSTDKLLVENLHTAVVRISGIHKRSQALNPAVWSVVMSSEGAASTDDEKIYVRVRCVPLSNSPVELTEPGSDSAKDDDREKTLSWTTCSPQGIILSGDHATDRRELKEAKQNNIHSLIVDLSERMKEDTLARPDNTRGGGVLNSARMMGNNRRRSQCALNEDCHGAVAYGMGPKGKRLYRSFLHAQKQQGESGDAMPLLLSCLIVTPSGRALMTANGDIPSVSLEGHDALPESKNFVWAMQAVHDYDIARVLSNEYAKMLTHTFQGAFLTALVELERTIRAQAGPRTNAQELADLGRLYWEPVINQKGSRKALLLVKMVADDSKFFGALKLGFPEDNPPLAKLINACAQQQTIRVLRASALAEKPIRGDDHLKSMGILEPGLHLCLLNAVSFLKGGMRVEVDSKLPFMLPSTAVRAESCLSAEEVAWLKKPKNTSSDGEDAPSLRKELESALNKLAIKLGIEMKELCEEYFLYTHNFLRLGQNVTVIIMSHVESQVIAGGVSPGDGMVYLSKVQPAETSRTTMFMNPTIFQYLNAHIFYNMQNETFSRIMTLKEMFPSDEECETAVTGWHQAYNWLGEYVVAMSEARLLLSQTDHADRPVLVSEICEQSWSTLDLDCPLNQAKKMPVRYTDAQGEVHLMGHLAQTCTYEALKDKIETRTGKGSHLYCGRHLIDSEARFLTVLRHLVSDGKKEVNLCYAPY
eukprot:Clim_evm4s150 gene=Clim_evmTU4s150